nr:ribonuclease H-like domain-containing protein [Tanacetum cinerariifolium]
DLFMVLSRHLTPGFSGLLRTLLLLDLLTVVVNPLYLFTKRIIAYLNHEFSMTNLGALNYFLGISVTRDSFGMFLSQQKYAIEILERAHMAGCTPSRTPADTESKLGDGDADWAGCLTMRQSTSGYCFFLGKNLLSWSSKRQPTLSHSSAKAQYRGVANAVAETCWIRNLYRELHTPLSFATIVYYDNVRVVYLSSNPVQHQRTKHIHFVWDLALLGRFAFYIFLFGFSMQISLLRAYLRHYLMSLVTV